MRNQLRVAARHIATKKPEVNTASKIPVTPKPSAKDGGVGVAALLPVGVLAGGVYYYYNYGLELPEILGGEAAKSAKRQPKPVFPKKPAEKDVTRDSAANVQSSSSSSSEGILVEEALTPDTKLEEESFALDEETKLEKGSFALDEETKIKEASFALDEETKFEKGSFALDEETKVEERSFEEKLEEFEVVPESTDAEISVRAADSPNLAIEALVRLRSVIEEEGSDAERLARLRKELASVRELIPEDDPTMQHAVALSTHLQINVSRAEIKDALISALSVNNKDECAKLIRRARTYGMDDFYELILAEHLITPGRLLAILHNDATGPYADASHFEISDFVNEETQVVQGIDDIEDLRAHSLEQTSKLATLQVQYRADAKAQLDNYKETVEAESSAFVKRAINFREEENAETVAKAVEAVRDQMRAEFEEATRTLLEEQEMHLREKFSQELAQEHDANELALEREREDFLLDQNDLKANVESYKNVLEDQSKQFGVFHTHRKLVNALLAIEKQIKNGQETNFDLVDDEYVQEVCELTGHPRGVTYEEPKDFIASFNRSLRSWVVSAFQTDDSVKTWALSQVFGRLYVIDRRGIQFRHDDESIIDRSIACLQTAAEYIEADKLVDALLTLESLDGTPALLKEVKPWLTKARTALLLQQQLELLRAQVACLHVSA